MKEFFTKLWADTVAFFSGNVWQLLGALVILVVGILVIKIVIGLIRRGVKKRKRDKAVSAFLLSVLSAVLYLALVIVIANILGISSASLIAVLSAVGLAVSLALQGSLSNVANGVVIISTKPFKDGDYISVDGVEGTVDAITLLNTRLHTYDNKLIIIPNNTIINSNITNYTGRTSRRVEWTLSVAYDSDLDLVKNAALEVLTVHAKILKEPFPTVRLSKQNQSSLDFSVKAWVNAADYWDVFFDINEALLIAMRKHNVTIPYSQLDVHLVDGKPPFSPLQDLPEGAKVKDIKRAKGAKAIGTDEAK